MVKNALSRHFDSSVEQRSPVFPSYERTVSIDEDGNEVVRYVVFDSATYQRSLGVVSLWSLDALMKAGISPDFPIHTGLPTRIEGVGTVEQYVSAIDSSLSDADSSDNSNE